MSMEPSPQASRIAFFDNLRFAFVASVVLNHTGDLFNRPDVFAGSGDPGLGVAYLVCLFTNVYIMPGLMFVAGYFALASLARRDMASFIVTRFRRLGLPWLVGIALIIPPWHFLTRAGEPPYRDWLWTYYINAAKFLTGNGGGFTQRHYWFLSLLLAFSLAFAFGRWLYLRIRRTPSGRTETIESRGSVTAFLLGLGLFTACGYAVVDLVWPMKGYYLGHFVTVGRILQFIPNRLVLEAAWFLTGAYAYQTGWFASDRFPRRALPWGIAATVLLAGTGWIGILQQRLPLPHPATLVLADAFVRSFACLCIIVAATILFRRRLAGPPPLVGQLGETSYIMYIIHNPLVATAALLLAGIGSVTGGLAAVFALSVVVSTVLSVWVVRVGERWGLAALVALNAALLVFR